MTNDDLSLAERKGLAEHKDHVHARLPYGLRDIRVTPYSPYVVPVGYEGHVQHSTDGGATWHDGWPSNHLSASAMDFNTPPAEIPGFSGQDTLSESEEDTIPVCNKGFEGCNSLTCNGHMGLTPEEVALYYGGPGQGTFFVSRADGIGLPLPGDDRPIKTSGKWSAELKVAEDNDCPCDATFNRPGEFREELRKLINRCSQEGHSNTPDFILAGFLRDSLDAFDKAVNLRTNYYQ